MLHLSNRGFTLPELLLAAAILAFALTGLLVLFSNCVLLNETNRNLVIATSHAQYLMEGVRHLSPLTTIAGQVNAGSWNASGLAINANWGLNPLSSEVITTTLPVGTNPLNPPDPLNITVTITWNDHGQRARNMALQTQITNY